MWIKGLHIKTNDRYDENGLDEHGFDRMGIHKITKTRYDVNGYDQFGFDENGYNKYGFDISGSNGKDHIKVLKLIYPNIDIKSDNIAINESLRESYETSFKIIKLRQQQRKFEENGLDQFGFDRNGIHAKTGTIHDENGFNALGYSKYGYDRNGYDVYGYDTDGYDEYGFSIRGKDRQGYDRQGLKKGFNRQGINKDTGTEYDLNGKDKNGKSEEEKKNLKEKKRKNFFSLLNHAEKLAKGEMSVEQYIMNSKTSIDELIEFAKKQKMSREIISGLYSKRREYTKLKNPFKVEEYLENTQILVGEQVISPTLDDVTICIEYLKRNGRLICNAIVSETIRKYIRGKIDITGNTAKTETLLESKEKDLTRLEEEEKIIAEAEALIDKQTAKEGQNIGE